MFGFLKRRPKEETAADVIAEALDFAERNRQRKLERSLRELGGIRRMDVPGKHPAVRSRRSRSLGGRR